MRFSPSSSSTYSWAYACRANACCGKFRQQMLVWLLVGVGAVVLSLTATATSSWASCGDYLAHSGTGAMENAVSLPAQNDPSTQNDPPMAHPDPVSPKPCDGPGCRRGLPIAIPPASPIPVQTLKQVAVPPGAADGCDDCDLEFLPLVSTTTVAVETHSRVERPPRV